VRVAIILNGISLKKKYFYSKIAPILNDSFHTQVFETRTKHDAINLAANAVDNQFDVIMAAGGDGTINQVVNGMIPNLSETGKQPVLGIIPLGSGNDFARTFGLTANPASIRDSIQTLRTVHADVGKIESTDADGKLKTCYFINVADAGMGPEVVEKVMKADRLFGAGFAYYSAILSTFFTYKPMEVEVRTESWQWKGKLRTLAIGNGKYYGHGLCIAPEARVDDGIFSSLIASDLSVAEFIWYSGDFKKSKKVNHPKLLYNTGRRFEVTSNKPCAVEADGELIGYLPATFSIMPQAVRVLC